MKNLAPNLFWILASFEELGLDGASPLPCGSDQYTLKIYRNPVS